MKGLKRLGLIFGIAIAVNAIFLTINFLFPVIFKAFDIISPIVVILCIISFYTISKNTPISILDQYRLIPQKRRQTYVLLWVVGVVGALISISSLEYVAFSRSTSMIPTIIGYTSFFLSFIFIGSAIFAGLQLSNSRYFILMGHPKTDADERDQNNKNNACRIAFRLCLVTTWLLLMLSNYIRPYNYISADNIIFMIGPWILLLLVASTPTLVYAWLEPDPIPE